MNHNPNLTEYQQLLMDRYAGTAKSKFEEGCLISLLLGPKEYEFENEMLEYLKMHPDAPAVELHEYASQFFPELEVVDDELDDEEWPFARGKTYQDVTALRDPLMGLGFEQSTGDALLTQDYNPNHDPSNGRFAKGSGGKSSKKTGAPRMGKKERARVSSGILTDHPNLKPGDTMDYCFGNYRYRFVVEGPGEYTFLKRVTLK